MKTNGRPTVITPKVVRELQSCLELGMSVREACSQSGISHEAYYYRLRKDEQFADKMYNSQQQPTIKAKMLLVAAISNGDLKSAKWWLERKEAQEFGVHRKVVVEEQIPEPENELSQLTDEQLIQLERELLELERGTIERSRLATE